MPALIIAFLNAHVLLSFLAFFPSLSQTTWEDLETLSLLLFDGSWRISLAVVTNRTRPLRSSIASSQTIVTSQTTTCSNACNVLRDTMFCFCAYLLYKLEALEHVNGPCCDLIFR